MEPQPEKFEAGIYFISPKMAKAMANEWRSKILAEVNLRTMSPSQFSKEVGGDLSDISRHFRQLAEWGFLELVEEQRGGGRRGGIEHVYRATQRACFDTPTWERLPLFLREEFSGSILEVYFRRITQALRARTLDKEKDRHLSWYAPSFDRQAWTKFVARLDEDLEFATELEVEAAKRMAESGEEPIPTTIGLACFRSPKQSEVKRVES